MIILVLPIPLKMSPSWLRTGISLPPCLGVGLPANSPRPSLAAPHEVWQNALCKKRSECWLGITVNTMEQDGAGVTVTLSDGGPDTGRRRCIRLRFVPSISGCRRPLASLDKVCGAAPAGWSDHLLSFHLAPAVPSLFLSQELMYLFVVTSEPGNPHMHPSKCTRLMRHVQLLSRLVGELKHKIVEPGKSSSDLSAKL